MENRTLVPRKLLESYHENYEIDISKPHIVDIRNRYALLKLHKIIKKYLKPDKKKKILEIGCAPGAWLNYFKTYYKYNPYGIELSLTGCLKSRKNFEIFYSHADIVCADALNMPFKDGAFDVVFSMGLIEHFSNPADIINTHINLTKKNGHVIIVVPNYTRLNKKILQKSSRSDELFLSAHNFSVCNKKGLKKNTSTKDVKIKFLSSCGIFYPEIYNLNLANVPQKINLLHKRITAFVKFLPFFDNTPLSPFVVLIAEKK